MDKYYGIIYMATNLINNKKYIGQTINSFEGRKRKHYNDKEYKGYFHKALKKYPKENWHWEIIDCANNKVDLDKKEKYWIKHYNTIDHNKGYNLTLGGTGNFEITNETREKISNANKGKKLSDKHKKIISETHKGKIVSKETKDKISRAHKGKILSDETKIKISRASANRQHSKETKQKISKSNKNQKRSLETCTKISNANKQRNFTRGNCPTAVKVICLNNNKIYDCIKDIEEELHISRASIRMVCKHKWKQVKGYIFEYYNEYIQNK